MIQKRMLKPNTMIYTRFGQIPNLTADLFEKYLLSKITGEKIYQIPLPSLIDSENIIKMAGGVKNFCRLSNDDFVHLSLLDPLGRRDIVSNNYIFLWSNGNRKKVNMQMYKSMLKSFRIDTYTAPFDFDISTADESSEKKNQKCLKRTTNFMETLLLLINYDGTNLNKGLIPSIGGGSSIEYRTLIAKELSQLFPDAHAISLDLYQWSEAQNSNKFGNDFITEIIKNTISHFPENILRIVEGPFNPDQVLFLIRQGIDLFDSSYAIMLTEKGMAFALDDQFPFGEDKQFTTINLNDKLHFDAHIGLFPNCQCYTCQQGYTRSYLYHLLKCKEMLATTLLTIHNMSEWLKLFSILRKEGDRRLRTSCHQSVMPPQNEQLNQREGNNEGTFGFDDQ